MQCVLDLGHLRVGSNVMKANWVTVCSLFLKLWSRKRLNEDAQNPIVATDSTTTASKNIPSEVQQPFGSVKSLVNNESHASPDPQAFHVSRESALLYDSTPKPGSSLSPKPVQLKKQPARFALGGSCSSSTIKSVSEGEGSLNRPTSLGNNPTTRSIGAEVDSDTDVDESAIDDNDDSPDWEYDDDSHQSEDDLSGKPSIDFSRRGDSKSDLPSKPSLITLMLAGRDDAPTSANPKSGATSQSTRISMSRAVPDGPFLDVSPNNSDEGPLMMKSMSQTTLKTIAEVPLSNPQPIPTTANHVHAQAALSPRTSRRNMLATELTESLRRHLLWERQQKSSTANAVLKRRHTAPDDVAHLKQYPDKSCMKQNRDNDKDNSWVCKLDNRYHSW